MRTFILVSPYSKPMTGAHIRFDRLAVHIIGLGHPVLWISPRRDDIPAAVGVEFIDTGDVMSKGFVSLWMSFAVLRNSHVLHKLRNHDALLIAFGESNLIPSYLASLLSKAPMSLGIRSNIRKIIRLGSNDAGVAHGYGAFLTRVALGIWGHIYRRARQVTVQTPQAKIASIQNFGIHESRIWIIENDLPVERTKGYEIRCPASLPHRVLFIGDDSRVKGFDILIEAFGAFAEHAPSVREMTVVGVSSRSFAELCRRASPRGPVATLLGRSHEIISLMAQHDLLVVPSREDQFPNVVLEALALGLPVVGSNVDGIAHILRDSELLFESGSAEDLLRVLARACTSIGYAHIQRVIKTRAQAFNFSWEERYFKTLMR